MKAKGNITHGVLFILIMLGMTLPFIQQHLNFVEVSPLKGAVETPSKAAFTLEGWFDGSYQEKEETYLNEAFGFRNTFVRINNQVAFSLFRKARANGVIIGKKNYLYELNYIKAYYGDDFIGYDSITKRIEKLKYIQDTLSKLNKSLLVVFAAGKGSFFPEYFPPDWKKEKISVTNLHVHDSLAMERGLNFINFNSFFISQKSLSPYPLYPQYGIHWSYYGSCLAADSMVSYMEQMRNFRMNHLYWDTVVLSQPQGTDYDIADGMNIKFKLRSYNMAYPDLKFTEDSTCEKPNVLVVADSYYWGMYNFGISKLFNRSDFWFYNKRIYPKSFKVPTDASSVDLSTEIRDHDIFIIMSTDATMHNFGWGFIERMYDYFTLGAHLSSKPIEDSILIEGIKLKMLSNPEWMKSIEQKAINKGISVDSMMILDAKWQLNQMK